MSNRGESKIVEVGYSLKFSIFYYFQSTIDSNSYI